MKVFFAIAFSFIPLLANAKPATSFPKSQWQQYHCLTLPNYLKNVPPCAVNCLKLGLDGGRDQCAPDDFVCHCAHTQKIDDILVPCITGSDSPNATCSDAEIGTLQGIVTQLCTFYNETQYADYVGCSPKLTLELAKGKLGIY